MRQAAPATVLTGLLVTIALLAVLCVAVALRQPALGLVLAVDGDRVLLRAVDPVGPGAALAPYSGAQVVAIGTPGAAPLPLIPDDLVEEPDTLSDGDRMLRFLDRQDRLAALLRAPQVAVTLRHDGADAATVTLSPAPARTLRDLPVAFWTQILVGVIGLGVGAWVVSLRQGSLAAWMLFLAGAGLAAAAQAAAIYSTRELALDRSLYAVLSRLNSGGTLCFGIGMVTLFLIYPRALVRGRWAALPGLVIGAVLVGLLAVDWPRHLHWMQAAIAAIMLVLLAAIAAQIVAVRRDPAARAMMGWLGLSVAFGAGSFVLTVIVPVLLGNAPLIGQSTAFLMFLLVYAGVALGVVRYRLFDLADWSRSLLTYALGVALLLGFDAVLIYGLSLDRLPALSVSLAVVSLLYLPLRSRLSALLHRQPRLEREDVYRRITEIMNTTGTTDRTAAVVQMWTDMFRPLAITRMDAAAAPAVATLTDHGRGLLLPSVAGLPALALDFAAQGSRLFSSRDRREAQSITALLDDTLTRHRTYQHAVAEERRRINRDMHDNLGILLLGALHSPDLTRKDVLIRQTLRDLRDIVSNPLQEPRDLTDLLADLRAEIAEAAEAAGLTLTWSVALGADDTGRAVVPAQVVPVIQSLLREGVSNILRHAQARTARVDLVLTDATLSIALTDDGRGFAPAAAPAAHGLGNLSQRLAQVGAALSVRSTPAGTTLSADLPLHTPSLRVPA